MVLMKIGYNSMIVKQGLPIRDFLNHAIFKMSENGQLDAIRKKWKLTQQDCTSNQKNTENPLSLKKLSILFFIISIGFGIALIIFLMETKYYFGQTTAVPNQETAFSIDELQTIQKNIQNIQDLLRRKNPNNVH